MFGWILERCKWILKRYKCRKFYSKDELVNFCRIRNRFCKIKNDKSKMESNLIKIK